MTGLVAAPMRVRGATAEPPPEAFTQVELIWIEKQTEHWIRFGRERRVQILDRRRRILVFPPGSVLALVRWAANEHGTVLSRLDILRTVDRDAPCQTVPTVTPGAEVCCTSMAGRRWSACSSSSTPSRRAASTRLRSRRTIGATSTTG